MGDGHQGAHEGPHEGAHEGPHGDPDGDMNDRQAADAGQRAVEHTKYGIYGPITATGVNAHGIIYERLPPPEHAVDQAMANFDAVNSDEDNRRNYRDCCCNKWAIGGAVTAAALIAVFGALAATIWKPKMSNSPATALRNGPVAKAITLSNQVKGSSVVFKIDGNVTADTSDIDWTTLFLIDMAQAKGSQDVTSIVVPKQGTWTVDQTAKTITFAPDTSLLGNPDPVSWWVKDNLDNSSNTASLTVEYSGVAPMPKPVQPPLAQDVTDKGFAGKATAVTVQPKIIKGDFDVDLTSVQLEGVMFVNHAEQPLTQPADKKSIIVNTQGTWTVDPASGAIKFEPFVFFTGNADPVLWTVADVKGNRSGTATVIINEIVDDLQKQIATTNAQTDAVFWADYQSVLFNATPPQTVAVIWAVNNDLLELTAGGLLSAGNYQALKDRTRIGENPNPAFQKDRRDTLSNWSNGNATATPPIAAYDIQNLWTLTSAFDDSKTGLGSIPLGTRFYRLAVVDSVLSQYLNAMNQ